MNAFFFLYRPEQFLKNQFVESNPLSYCFEETIDFDKYVSFVKLPESPLIKPGDIRKEFQLKAIQLNITGLFMD